MKELSEKDYIAFLEQRTGRKFSEDFGFIAGTWNPFETQRMQSSAKIHGCQVWHKVGEKTYNLNVYPSTQENTLEHITNFINFTFVDPDGFIDYLSQKGSMIIDVNKTE
jgi:hypothetical protein